MQTDTLTAFFDSFLSSPDEKITVRFLKDRNKAGNNTDASAGIVGTMAALAPMIEARNRTDWGAYFVVNHTGTESTTDAAVKHARALFIDIDDAACPEYFPVTPSAILRRFDGLGWHIYWFFDAPETDLEKWTNAQKQLIHFYKSDKTIHNPARVMRIPGTVNHKDKYTTPQIYEIAELSGARYALDAVILGHADKSAYLKIARRKARAVFPDHKMVEGEGRHGALIKASFIFNDYGFTPEETFNELKRLIDRHFEEPISDEKIRTYVKARTSAQNETGAKSVEKALQEQAKIERAKELLREWYYIRQQESFFCEGSETAVSITGFNAKFAHALGVSTPARYVFLNDCIRQYECIDYAPGLPLDVADVSGVNRNTYTAPDLEPVDARPDWFINHLEYLIPDKREREHFLDYFAYLIQNPGAKVMHGILIIGRQGVGKSILARVFEQLFGKSNVNAPHNEQFSGNFTGWAKHCQLVIINELLQIDKKDFNNKIKPYITEPTVDIREMYKAPYTIKNHLNILAFSNHENALYIDKDDRRWFIIRSDATKKPAAYYDKLIEAMDTRAGEVLHFFQSRDVSAFRPGAEPPMTAAKGEIIVSCRSDLEAWIHEGLESGAAPFDSDITTLDDIREALPRELNGRYTSANRISRILREIGARPIEERIRVRGVRMRFWVLRDADQWPIDRVKEQVRVQYGAEDAGDDALVM